MTKITSDVDRLRITKANKLNEAILVETGAKLSLPEQKVILSIVGQISDKDEDFKDYKITIPELIKITGIDKHNLYRDIRRICSKLMSSVLTIKEPNDPEGFVMASWFAHARYSKKEGVVEFSFSPKLKPYLLKIQGSYTTYWLRQVVNLSSTYSIRIYELLRQFLTEKKVYSEGKKHEFRKIDIKDLRGYLGISDNKYKSFKDFRVWVLEKAQKELKEKTDITFDFKPIKKGRSYHSINFYIKHNERFEPVEEDETIDGKVDSNKLINELEYDFIVRSIKEIILDISDMELEMILQMYPKMVVQESLLDLFRAVTQRTDVGDKMGYFKGILINKMKEYQKDLDARKPKTTEEKLTDKSWADDIDPNDLECYPDDY